MSNDVYENPVPYQLHAQDLTCIECARSWLEPLERWRLYLTDEPFPEPVLYCSDCADREFGG
jgi:hypothetical protein